jgi:branched-subunit amino acid transport protein
MIDRAELWFVIIALGIGSYLLRFSFLGLVGNRPLPAWLLRHLRYTAVAILPALVAPIVYYSNETQSGPEPVRLVAAIVTFAVGFWTKNVFLAIVAGATVMGIGLYGLQ